MKPNEKCRICGNQRDKNGRCAYCAWKGTEGKGALLKKIIKQENDKR